MRWCYLQFYEDVSLGASFLALKCLTIQDPLLSQGRWSVWHCPNAFCEVLAMVAKIQNVAKWDCEHVFMKASLPFQGNSHWKFWFLLTNKRRQKRKNRENEELWWLQLCCEVEHHLLKGSADEKWCDDPPVRCADGNPLHPHLQRLLLTTPKPGDTLVFAHALLSPSTQSRKTLPIRVTWLSPGLIYKCVCLFPNRNKEAETKLFVFNLIHEQNWFFLTSFVPVKWTEREIPCVCVCVCVCEREKHRSEAPTTCSSFASCYCQICSRAKLWSQYICRNRTQFLRSIHQGGYFVHVIPGTPQMVLSASWFTGTTRGMTDDKRLLGRRCIPAETSIL